MVEEIDAAELESWLEEGTDIQIVDVRPEHAFRRGHLPGAENLPIHRFTEDIEDIDWGSEVLLACPHGKSSRQAARLLEAYDGIDDARIMNLSAGYEGWPYELETDHEGEGEADAESPF